MTGAAQVPARRASSAARHRPAVRGTNSRLSDPDKRLSLTGEYQIVEINPAASLTAYGAGPAGFNPNSYKNEPTARQTRELLAQSFVSAKCESLNLTSEHQQECGETTTCSTP
jgi:hypothetical protein